ncbi:MAG: DUF2510 domain-containing protein [Ilumatobacteraceae bacterium]
MEPTSSPAGWHPDPSGRYEFRYYNGERWTADVSMHGQRFVDPVDSAAAPAAGPAGPAGPVAPVGHAPGWGPKPTMPSRPSRGFAITAFVIGLGAFLAGWIPFVFVIAAVAAIAALVFGILALRRISAGTAAGKGFAVAGLVLAIAAFGSAFVGLQFTRAIVDTLDEFIDVGPHDTTVTRCTVDGTIVEFDGTITNRDVEQHSYVVVVNYVIDGRIVDSDALKADFVEPGDTAPLHGTGIIRDGEGGTEAECRIALVTGPTLFAPTN